MAALPGDQVSVTQGWGRGATLLPDDMAALRQDFAEHPLQTLQSERDREVHLGD
jgi:hypothetical protein